ncbi:uncharacterized protein [Dysidea avara]|uniref:uncharacterized protein isoform X2 n=1 Tax=Dysidea avara TaxID=196820 RepID=UPI00331DC0AE
MAAMYRKVNAREQIVHTGPKLHPNNIAVHERLVSILPVTSWEMRRDTHNRVYYISQNSWTTTVEMLQLVHILPSGESRPFTPQVDEHDTQVEHTKHLSHSDKRFVPLEVLLLKALCTQGTYTSSRKEVSVVLNDDTLNDICYEW